MTLSIKMSGLANIRAKLKKPIPRQIYVYEILLLLLRQIIVEKMFY